MKLSAFLFALLCCTHSGFGQGIYKGGKGGGWASATYRNPAASQREITLYAWDGRVLGKFQGLSAQDEFQVTAYDCLGRTLYSARLIRDGYQVRLPHVAKGMYLVVLEGEGKRWIKKVVQ